MTYIVKEVWYLGEGRGKDAQSEPRSNQSHPPLSGLGGSILYSFYNNSVHKAITTIYPSHKWHEWEFERLNAKFWKDLANRRRFLDHVAHSQSITNWDGYGLGACFF
jgi:hypothetical protein